MKATDIQRYKTTLEHLRTIYNLSHRKPLLIRIFTGDLRVLYSNDIGYFRYTSKKKSWEMALADGSFIRLKRYLRAEDLCTYNDNFIQIHQSYVINLHYLHMIKDRSCILSPPFQATKGLPISQKHRKSLLVRFNFF